MFYFREESLQVIDYTGTDNQDKMKKTNSKTLQAKITQNTHKYNLLTTLTTVSF